MAKKKKPIPEKYLKAIEESKKYLEEVKEAKKEMAFILKKLS